MRKSLTLIALGALATGLIAAGCGGDDDDSGDSDLTKAEFVEQANAICDEGNAELDAAGEEAFGNGQPNEEELSAFVVDELVPNVHGQIDDIRDLGIPEESDDVNGTLDSAEDILDDLESDPAQLAQGDPFAPVNEDLTAAGLSSCAG